MKSLVSLVANTQLPLEKLALAIGRRLRGSDAADEYFALRRLDELADGLLLPPSPAGAARALSSHLHEKHGFDGDRDSYFDPKNCDLASVLRSGRGLPLTLSILYSAVAERVGHVVEPIGFPSHFLVRHGGSVYQDPFHGGHVLSEGDFDFLASRVMGSADGTALRHLAPIARPALAVRMLANFRNAFAKQHDHSRALLACDALVELTGAPEAWRDRGQHALALGATLAASADLESYLRMKPDAHDRDDIHAAIRRCKKSFVLN